MSVVYEFGPFRLDVGAKALTRAGMPTPLGPRAVAVLATLVDRPNEYVPKARIVDSAWPGLVVEEGNLTVQISAIRRVLAEAPGGARWIETLSRRGYRFTGPVTRIVDPREGAAAAARTNLPEALTSFIGRERELVEVKRLLTTTRLLTLTGVGGIGKTRLAQQVAAEVIDAYRDGVWFVDLAPLADPALVATATAQVLGVGDEPGQHLPVTLGERLRDREMLLVLDNCEHLPGACAELAVAVLRRAAGVTLLATSREPVKADGEQVYPLLPLALPDPSSGTEAIAASESAQLFLDRARHLQPHFELASAVAPALAHLCKRLDGIPLALELAAARTPSLSIAQINARLDDRFRLLVSGTRTALPRHQTLRATLDWSHGLLSEAERAAWRRAAVFPGTFTLEAAASVVAGPDIDDATLVDLVARLVSHSLIVAEARASGVRYRLLETTRAYGLERLREAGETEAVACRHAEFVRRLFERSLHDWWRMPEAEWLARYAVEVDGVRAALDWAFGPGGDATLGVALAGTSAPVWHSLSLTAEGTRRLQDAAARIDAAVPDAEQAQLHLWIGNVLQIQQPGEAIVALQRSSFHYERAGDRFGVADARMRQASTLMRMGRIGEARSMLASIDAEVERSGLPKMRAFKFSELALIETLSGDLAAARRHYEAARSLFVAMKYDFGSRTVTGSLADLSWGLGDLEAARSGFIELIALLRAAPDARRAQLGYALCNLAGVLVERGDLVAALAAAREGLPMLLDSDRAWIFADHVALRAALAGRLDAAARLAGYADAAQERRQTARGPNEVRARERLRSLLADRLETAELQRLQSEGARLSDEDACRLALED